MTSWKEIWSVTDVKSSEIIICPNNNKPDTDDYKTACDESLKAKVLDEDGKEQPAEARDVLKVQPAINGFPEYIALNEPVDMKWFGGPRTELKADLIILDFRFNSIILKILFYVGCRNIILYIYQIESSNAGLALPTVLNTFRLKVSVY